MPSSLGYWVLSLLWPLGKKLINDKYLINVLISARFLFYEDWEENYRMRKTYMEELERKFDEASESDSVSVDTNTSER